MNLDVSPDVPSIRVRRSPPRRPRRDLGFMAMAVAVGLATAGGVIVARGMILGTGAWHVGHALVLLGGALLCGAGIFLVQRGLRRRAELRTIAKLMPRYREHIRRATQAGAADQMRRLAGEDDWQTDAPEWSEDGNELPRARAEMRAATRALLVSLADELRQESRRGRGARPACRHARLRAAGRGSVERRRRVVVPPGRSLS